MEYDGKVDVEEAKFIKEVMAMPIPALQKLDLVIDWKKKNRGLRGWHPCVMPNLDGKDDGLTVHQRASQMAEDMLQMMYAVACGRTRRVTDEELGRM